MFNKILLNAVAEMSYFDKLWAIISSFTDNPIKNIFDILILTLVLFFAVRFVRGKKAGVLLIGISVLLLIKGVADWRELTATSELFAAIFDAGIITLIVIFSPEIREALERVGTGSISGIMSFGDQKKKKLAYSKAIEDIAVAVTDLSSTKTGALIVISNAINLDEIAHTGVQLNADVSSFLLRNIFFNKAPLHDGAVVIDDGKITAAGCLLPLTRRTDIDSDIGTRHRAAVGMSEISDAIIIVVSEETGTISVARDCELIRGFTPDTLRQYLTTELIKTSRSLKNKSSND